MLAKMDNKALYLYELNLDNFLMLKMIFGQNSDQCAFKNKLYPMKLKYESSCDHHHRVQASRVVIVGCPKSHIFVDSINNA